MLMTRIVVLAFGLAAAIALTGCTSVAPSPAPAPSATQSAETGTTTSLPPVESLESMADTRWIGKYSNGDTVTFKFNSDGSVKTTSYGVVLDAPDDAWTVTGGTIVWTASFGARYGTITHVATLDVALQILSGSTTSTVGESGTIELRQPAR